ncbi:type IV pili twitching motility protein PilT [candidate division WWE3 bacterium CG09_land_8_20_14_0_10_47_33]|uniref:Type IV pili twitching motility protein PilT n=1 Tax=candidate division WWE3 bacterium CG_4_9_14_0_2_um_filter_48_10 TaxID=1975078 RepID=A0A2M8EIT2_UNCKA|nr:MAG: type IV pili twitching motility protein PilT [candidate division WWE3 bacterium CG09_land_8_20_14_0_10_47_33]PJC22601.1 MAG: type IV pili twitching motility protein PilT [candidate division WWE3 bacterium CG_4_9_14_0_2_um_filter_48_10]PJE52363.1 MAG: type IV pili twitching motility protein PilT [candidate division WWE3 bacterium CG10_big_fil_rev_8_21_14_0_10_48_23]
MAGKVQIFLQKAVEAGASDLHLTVGAPPTLRIQGDLSPIAGESPLGPEEVESLIFELLSEEQKDLLLTQKEIDFSFAYGDVARFRVNAFHQRGYLAASLRRIPLKIPTIDELNLPKILFEFCDLPQGFILVTGPTGHGKSTTLAAMLQRINETRPVHIVTIEDPIEYIFPHRKALVDQREMHLDTYSWEVALRSALREDPNVVMIGEMRDYETIASAITIAETGHLVFATLHTNSASQTIDRIIDAFPEMQQQQVRVQLSAILEGVISQRLVPSTGRGLVPAVELMLPSPAVRSIIREGKTHQLDNVIATSFDQGMVSLERALVNLVKEGLVDPEVAKLHTIKPEEFARLLK